MRPAIMISLLEFIAISNMFRWGIVLLQSTPAGQLSGSFLKMPLSFGITAVTKKKINNKNAISAIDPAFTSGLNVVRFILIRVFLMK